MAPKRFKEVPHRDPSTPAGGKTALSGDSSFQARIFPSADLPFPGEAPAERPPRALSAGPRSPRPCGGSARPYLLLHVGIAERHGGGGDSGGDNDSGGGGRRPEETRPVPSVAASRIRSGSCHRGGGASANHAHRLLRLSQAPTAPPTSCPAHSTTGPIGMQITCDVTLLYKARRVSRHFQCENSLR